MKIVGMMEVGAPIVRMGWHLAGLSVRVPLLSSTCTMKSRRWHVLTRMLGITPWHPHMPKQTGGAETQPEHRTTLC